MRSDLRSFAFSVAGPFASLPGTLPWRGLSVYLFHDVVDKPAPFHVRTRTSVLESAFREHIDWIANKHAVLHVDDLKRSTLPDRGALITFDDGFLGTFQRALPYLEERGIPAVVFLNMGVATDEPNVTAVAAFLEERRPELLVGGAGSDAIHRLGPSAIAHLLGLLGAGDREALESYSGLFADQKEIAAWDHHPLFRFGNHLWNHYSCTALTSEELRHLYARNREALHRLRSSIDWFALPFGQIDERTSAELVALQPERILTGRPRPNHTPQQVLDRFDMGSVAGDGLQRKGYLLLSRLTRGR